MPLCFTVEIRFQPYYRHGWSFFTNIKYIGQLDWNSNKNNCCEAKKTKQFAGAKAELRLEQNMLWDGEGQAGALL